MRHARSILTACLCVFVGCILLDGPPAQARVVHLFEKSFGAAGSGAGQFNNPVGVAVNDVTHDVYVVDRGNNRVQEFNSTGTYIREFNGSGSPTGVFSNPTQIAVDNSGNPLDPSSGDVYVVDYHHNVIDKFSEAGVYVGQLTGTTCAPPVKSEEVLSCPKSGTVYPFEGFEELQGVAVDPTGTLWTVQSDGFIDSFSNGQISEPLSTRKTEIGGGLRQGLAVDGEDNIYINPDGIAKVNSTGKTLIDPYPASFCGGFIHGEYFNIPEEASNVAIDLSTAYAFVDKFSFIAVCGFAGEPIESFGSGHLTNSKGVAVDASIGESSSGAVYASDSVADSVVIFATVTLPTVSVTAPSIQQPRSLTLNGTVDPEGHSVTSCVFEYGPTSAYGHSVPCSPTSPGSGSVPVAVSVHIAGLTPESEYHYRLVAANSGGSEPTADHEFFTGPVLGGEYVTGVTSVSATLNVSLDANGGDTHYYFEYGSTPAYGAFAPVLPPGMDVGSPGGAQLLSVHLQGLRSGVSYHYRVVAEQGGELFEEPDGVFTTQTVSGGRSVLPDGRAWELVSPANKRGALIGVAANLENPALGEQASSGGGAIAYQADEPILEGVAGRRLNSENLAVHGAGGWSSRDINAPKVLPPDGNLESDHVGEELFYLFSPDLSRVVFEPAELYTGLVEGLTERTEYVRNDLSETYEPLVSEAYSNVVSGVKLAGSGFQEEQMRIEAVTPDLSHVFIESPLAFTADAGKGSVRENLYEWSAGELQFIGEGVIGGGGGTFGAEMSQRAVSSDGRWVVIRQGATDGKATSYLVRDTVEGRSVAFGGSAPHFETMSSDGSRVFYLETEGGGGKHEHEQGELYVLDPSTGTTKDLTATHLVGEANAEVQNQVSVSEDGRYVYFVATGVLAAGGVKGADNLYLLHEEGDGTWSTRFMATLSAEDQPDWRPHDYSVEADLRGLESRVSADGRYLAFMSNRSLTGYDNKDVVSGQPDEEVFLYDATGEGGAGKLVCVSCDPTGARPVGIVNDGYGPDKSPLLDRVGTWSSATEGVAHSLAGVLPPAWYGGAVIGSAQYAGYRPRYLFDDGRLFFNSADALVPQDTNGVADVYEYEPPGVGSCTFTSATFSVPSGGCVNLISAGQSASESVFSDASDTGDDVFFVTPSRLVAEDSDAAYDLYDAHVCGSGWACTSASVGPPACRDEESCRAAASPQPAVFGVAPSATFSGAGNILAESRPSVAPKGLSAKEGLTRALRACRGKRSKHKRTVCERDARVRFKGKQARRAKVTRRAGK